MSTSNSLQEQMYNEISMRTAEIDLPNCHGIKQKILRRFIGARLQFFAKMQRLIRKGIERNVTKCQVKVCKCEKVLAK